MLWISLRMFEERRNLLTRMGLMTKDRSGKRANRQRLLETQRHIERIGSMLLIRNHGARRTTLTRVEGLMAEPRRAKSTRR